MDVRAGYPFQMLVFPGFGGPDRSFFFFLAGCPQGYPAKNFLFGLNFRTRGIGHSPEMRTMRHSLGKSSELNFPPLSRENGKVSEERGGDIYIYIYYEHPVLTVYGYGKILTEGISLTF